jgi:hypothetical protein
MVPVLLQTITTSRIVVSHIYKQETVCKCERVETPRAHPILPMLGISDDVINHLPLGDHFCVADLDHWVRGFIGSITAGDMESIKVPFVCRAKEEAYVTIKDQVEKVYFHVMRTHSINARPQFFEEELFRGKLFRFFVVVVEVISFQLML